MLQPHPNATRFFASHARMPLSMLHQPNLLAPPFYASPPLLHRLFLRASTSCTTRSRGEATIKCPYLCCEPIRYAAASDASALTKCSVKSCEPARGATESPASAVAKCTFLDCEPKSCASIFIASLKTKHLIKLQAVNRCTIEMCTTATHLCSNLLCEPLSGAPTPSAAATFYCIYRSCKPYLAAPHSIASAISRCLALMCKPTKLASYNTAPEKPSQTLTLNAIYLIS